MLAIAAAAASTHPRLVERPAPFEPAAGEVLCRTLELGICGTDRDILQSGQPLLPPGEEYLVLGHECLARIEQIGDGVTDWAVGDLAVPVVRRAHAGQTRRVDMLPMGTFTERGIMFEHGFSAPLWLDRPEHLYRVPQEVASVAVLTEPVAVAEKGVNEALVLQQARLGAQTWQTVPPRVLVTGMGPIGFAGVLSCRARNWPVTVYGRDRADSFRSDLAQRLGASYIASLDPPGDVEQQGYDLILECTGSDDVLLSAAALLASCGSMVWLGSSRIPQAKPHNVERLMRDSLMGNHLHLGCVNAAPRDFHSALAALTHFQRHQPAALASLITARVAPAESLPHYEHRQPQGIKTVLMYS